MISLIENSIHNEKYTDLHTEKFITETLSTSIMELKSLSVQYKDTDLSVQEKIKFSVKALKKSLPRTLALLLSCKQNDNDQKDLTDLFQQLEYLSNELILKVKQNTRDTDELIQKSISQLESYIEVIKIIARHPQAKKENQIKKGLSQKEMFFTQHKNMKQELAKHLSVQDYCAFNSVNKDMLEQDDNSSWEELFKRDFSEYYRFIKSCKIECDYKFSYTFAKNNQNISSNHFFTLLFITTQDVLNFAKLRSSVNWSDYDEDTARDFSLTFHSQRILDYLFWLNDAESPIKQFENAILYNQPEALADISSEVKAQHVNLLKLTKYKIPPLHFAALNGKVELLGELLKIPGINVNLYDNNYRTALLCCAHINNFEMMELLINHNADINGALSDDFCTLLEHTLCGYKSHIPIATELQLNSNNKSKSVFLGPINVELIPFLLTHGASFNLKNSYGFTAIQMMRLMLPAKLDPLQGFVNTTKVLLKALDEDTLKKEIFDRPMIEELYPCDSPFIMFESYVKDFGSNMYSCMLLVAAVRTGDTETLEWLIKHSTLLQQDFAKDKVNNKKFLKNLFMIAASQSDETLEILIQGNILPKHLISPKFSK